MSDTASFTAISSLFFLSPEIPRTSRYHKISTVHPLGRHPLTLHTSFICYAKIFSILIWWSTAGTVSVHSLLAKTSILKSGKPCSLPLLENQMPLSPLNVIQSCQHFSHTSPSAVFQYFSKQFCPISSC